jgi:hypothetical protein
MQQINIRHLPVLGSSFLDKKVPLYVAATQKNNPYHKLFKMQPVKQVILRLLALKRD